MTTTHFLIPVQDRLSCDQPLLHKIAFFAISPPPLHKIAFLQACHPENAQVPAGCGGEWPPKKEKHTVVNGDLYTVAVVHWIRSNLTRPRR